MTFAEAIRRLSEQPHQNRQLSMHECVTLLFEGTVELREYKARGEIIREIIKAKREAGFQLRCVFFRDVWPPALAALKLVRATQKLVAGPPYMCSECETRHLSRPGEPCSKPVEVDLSKEQP